MNKRRYREHSNYDHGSGGRIRDFFKGWGTVHKDGKSILWDTWRPPTKRQKEKALKRISRLSDPDFKIQLPVFSRPMPKFDMNDIVSVQPMSAPLQDESFFKIQQG